jgi:hypothetical protein
VGLISQKQCGSGLYMAGGKITSRLDAAGIDQAPDVLYPWYSYNNTSNISLVIGPTSSPSATCAIRSMDLQKQSDSIPDRKRAVSSSPMEHLQ